jgi:acyl-[acyl carrier protein]--UDP-N-acetylglucosamine O-acyltransferase
MRVRISSYAGMGSDDQLVETEIDDLVVAYGQVEGRKYVALGRNVSKLRKLFESSNRHGTVAIMKQVFEVDE